MKALRVLGICQAATGLYEVNFDGHRAFSFQRCQRGAANHRHVIIRGVLKVTVDEVVTPSGPRIQNGRTPFLTLVTQKEKVAVPSFVRAMMEDQDV